MVSARGGSSQGGGTEGAGVQSPSQTNSPSIGLDSNRHDLSQERNHD